MRRIVVAAAVLAVAVFVVARSRESSPAVSAAGQGAAGVAGASATGSPSSASPSAASPSTARLAAAPAARVPSLGDDAPFRGEDLAMTSDAAGAPVVELRSSVRSGRDLAVELGAREPLADGARVFATVSVSDALGNTIIDCTWRDIELTGEARKLACELPAGVELPLAISGHQRSAPSFVENPTVVAIDQGVR